MKTSSATIAQNHGAQDILKSGEIIVAGKRAPQQKSPNYRFESVSDLSPISPDQPKVKKQFAKKAPKKMAGQ